jgi:Skp family chaperone for outer membrane proteins
MKEPTADKVNRLIDKLTAIQTMLAAIRDDLQEKYDSMRDDKQKSNKGETLKREIAALDTLIVKLEGAEDARPEE